jgi:hypothetical protein
MIHPKVDVWVTETMTFNPTDLVTNGDFTSGTGWNPDEPFWEFIAGEAVHSGTGPRDLYQLGYAANRTYRVTFDMTQTSGVGVQVIINNGTPGTTRAATGTFTEDIVAGATTAGGFGTGAGLVFRSIGAGEFTIDNVEVYEQKTYTSLKSAIELEAQDTTGNGPFVIVIIDPINEPTGDFQTLFDDWTTTAADYLHVWVHPQVRHKGYWNPAEHFSIEMSGTDFTHLDGDTDYVRLEGLAFCSRNTTPGGRAHIGIGAATTGEGNNLLEIVDHLSVATRGSALITAVENQTAVGCDIHIRNSVFVGLDRGIYGSQGYTGSPRALINNCTFIDCADSIRLGDVMEVKNCIFVNSPPDYTWGGSEPYGSANHRNNVGDLTSDIDQLNGSGHVITRAHFMNEYEFDGRLKPGMSEHLRVGIDLANETNPVHTDAVNRLRRGPHYVGALIQFNSGVRGKLVDTRTMKQVYRGGGR